MRQTISLRGKNIIILKNKEYHQDLNESTNYKVLTLLKLKCENKTIIEIQL